MSSNGLNVTVVGWVATAPREVVGEGVPFTSFRVGTTPRRFDSRQEAWVDGRTEWITVKAFRDVAHNVAASIHKGEPVVVHGRLQTEEWTGENGQRTGLVLEATALGHDLTRGRTEFTRRVYTNGAAGQDSGAGDPGRSEAGPGEDDAAPDPWATEAALSGREHAGSDDAAGALVTS